MVVGALLVPVRRAAAVSVTRDQLASAALAVADLPGFRLVSEDTPPDPDENFQAGVRRMFAPDDPTQFAPRISVTLLAPYDALPQPILKATVAGGGLLKQFSSRDGYQPLGALGVGDADQAASFQLTDQRSGLTFLVYIDTALRGRVIVFTTYAVNIGAPDQATFAAYAAQQDAKIVGDSALPPGLVNPGTRDTISTHRWYTSADPSAAVYFCDDDPGWRAIALDSLQSYATVQDLLADYPGRTLDKPCLDGATGP
jgi:hypothetical protein